jgi:hypothetical protein
MSKPLLSFFTGILVCGMFVVRPTSARPLRIDTPVTTKAKALVYQNAWYDGATVVIRLDFNSQSDHHDFRDCTPDKKYIMFDDGQGGTATWTFDSQPEIIDNLGVPRFSIVAIFKASAPPQLVDAEKADAEKTESKELAKPHRRHLLGTGTGTIVYTDAKGTGKQHNVDMQLTKLIRI